MESYFDFTFCSILNTMALNEASRQGELGKHFGNFSNLLNSSTTVFYLVCLVVFPINAYFKIKNNLGSLHKKSVRDKIGFYYEGIKTEQPVHAYFNLFFMARRLLTGLIMIFMSDLPFF